MIKRIPWFFALLLCVATTHAGQNLSFPYKWDVAASPAANRVTLGGSGLNNPATSQIRIAETDNDGYNNAAFFATLKVGTYITLTETGAATNSYGTYIVNAVPVDSGIYWTFNVTPVIQHEFWFLSTATFITVDFKPLSGVAVTPASGVKLWDTNGFRLTLVSGDPSYIADISGSTLYWTPYTSDAVALYDGTTWNIRNVSQRSLALSGLVADKIYDVFVYDNAGTPTLELGPAWTNSTTRATAIVRQNGVYCKSGALTRRYVGSFIADTATTAQSTHWFRHLYNYSNPLPTPMVIAQLAAHNYNNPVVRKFNNTDFDSTCEILVGVGNERALLGSAGTYGYGGTGSDARIAVSVSTNPADTTVLFATSMSQTNFSSCVWVDPPRDRLPQGRVYVRLLEYSLGGTSFYGYSFRNYLFDL